MTPLDHFTFFILVLKFFSGILIFVTMCKYAQSSIKKQRVMCRTSLYFFSNCFELFWFLVFEKISSTPFEGKELYQLVGGVAWGYISPIISCSR